MFINKVGIVISMLFSLFIALSESAASTCRLQSENADYCGPAGNSKISRIIPDEFFGPFKAACERHDYCYYDGGSIVISAIENKNRVSLAGIDAKMRREFKGMISDLRARCDEEFSINLKTACGRTEHIGCKSAATAYYGVVRIVARKIFTSAINEAMRCRG